jgi:methylmalonyl-CoA mutase N-terminal domain/subunit
LTDDIEAEAFDIIDDIDERGGMLPSVQNQWVQRQIQDTAYERQREIEQGERIIVGVNEFTVEDDEPQMDVEQVTEEDERRQVASLESVKADRDEEAVENTLAALRDTARGDGNLLPPIVDAVKAYASVGEICNVLRDEYGEYQPGAAM